MENTSACSRRGDFVGSHIGYSHHPRIFLCFAELSNIRNRFGRRLYKERESGTFCCIDRASISHLRIKSGSMKSAWIQFLTSSLPLSATTPWKRHGDLRAWGGGGGFTVSAHHFGFQNARFCFFKFVDLGFIFVLLIYDVLETRKYCLLQNLKVPGTARLLLLVYPWLIEY